MVYLAAVVPQAKEAQLEQLDPEARMENEDLQDQPEVLDLLDVWDLEESLA